MQGNNMPIKTQSKQLYKIIRSLSDLSKVETKEIRNDIKKSLTCSNKNRIKHQVEKDQLLNEKKKIQLPKVIFTHKLIKQRDNKIGSLKEKHIQSEASLRRVNFQYKKLMIKRQKMAKKHYQSKQRYKSTPHLEKQTFQIKDINNIQFSSVFQHKALGQSEAHQEYEQLLQKVKCNVNTSRNRIKTTYDKNSSNVQSLKKSLNLMRKEEANPEKNINIDKLIEQNQLRLSLTQEKDLIQPVFTKTQSILIFKPNKKEPKRKSLVDLIKMSTSRQKNKEQRRDERLTQREAIQLKATENLIKTLHNDIDHQNKLKESIVFGGLKKLLYGDRRGRFIQDTTFRTRLKGQNSQQYLTILEKQEQILQNFQGSLINKRNLAEKFSSILGMINRSEKHFHQLKFKY